MADTLFADVSEFQVPVNNSYTDAGYRFFSLRSNDGGHRDANFYKNYAWAAEAADAGRITGFVVYFYWRPGSTDVDTHIDMVTRAGGPHPKMVSMLDLESGGNPGGDQSWELNREYERLTGWLGDEKRVIGYANLTDERTMWQFKPQHVPFILAGYGANPSDPTVFQIAHQYTDGAGFGHGLPEGAPPFGNCDMNAANGHSPEELATALGIESIKDEDDMAGWTPELVFRAMVLLENQAGVRRPSTARFRHPGEGDVNTCAGFAWTADGNVYDDLIIKLAEYGDPDAIRVLQEVANADLQRYPDRHGDAALAKRVLDKLPR